MRTKVLPHRAHTLVRAVLAQAQAISEAAQEFALTAEHDYDAAFYRYKQQESAAYRIYIDVLTGGDLPDVRI
jgi:hypothetical protein